MKTSEEIKDIADALSKAQGAMQAAKKDSNNPAFRSKYADIASVMSAAREPLAANGLSIFQDVSTLAEGVSVTTRILHSTGQWLETEAIIIPLGKRDAHGVGSAVTYGRRFSLCAAIGIVPDDDDDGNGAVQSSQGAPAQKPQSPTPSADKDKAARAAYDAKKAAYAVQIVTKEDGSTDWDTFVADLEMAMPNMKNMDELSLLKVGNGANLKRLADADASLFEHIKGEFEKFGNALK